MKKIFFVFSIFAFIILVSTSIFAAPAAPSPVCKINAKIIKVDYIKAHFQRTNYCLVILAEGFQQNIYYM